MKKRLLLFLLVHYVVPAEGASLRSAYLGISRLVPQSFVSSFCGNVTGMSAMPVTFSERVRSSTPALDPSLFRVSTNRGDVTPVCATLQPAYGEEKNLTVLLVGNFDNSFAQTPQLVEVVGDLFLEDGSNAKGLNVAVTLPTATQGARVVDARLRSVYDLASAGGCPPGTSHVAILVFEGGETGRFGTAFGPAQIRGTYLYASGRRVDPLAIAGDFDNDNFVNACVSLSGSEASGPINASVEAGTYFDPANRPNVSGNFPMRAE